MFEVSNEFKKMVMFKVNEIDVLRFKDNNVLLFKVMMRIRCLMFNLSMRIRMFLCSRWQ